MPAFLRRCVQWIRAAVLGRGRATLGARGEAAAARYLKRRGYRILQRNLSMGDDEADLVALDPDRRTIVLIEVKTRRSEQPAPEASVGRVKQHRLSRTAARLQRTPRYQDRPFRIDVIAVVWPEHGRPQLRHIPSAFESAI